MNLKTRWHDLVRKPKDAATNDVCSIRQVEHSRYHLTTGIYTGNNYLTADTAEGVDLMLEEFHIRDEEWKKIQ